MLLYLGAFSPLGVGLAVLVGTCDRDHHALLQSGSEGTRLVMRHDPKCAAHQHGLLARTLTLFAEPKRAGEADHVLQFSAADTLARPAQLAAPAPETFASPDLTLRELPLPFPLEDLSAPFPAHAPPDGYAPLRSLRSTVLLI